MQRKVTTALGLVAVALAVWIVVRNFRPPAPVGHEAPTRVYDSGSDAFLYALGDAGLLEDDPARLLGESVAVESRVDGGAGSTMPDGTPVPPLPATAPRSVRFGVVLVSYSGAQPTATGARPAARSRADAKTLADRLMAAAQQDFHGAVQQGDAGSADDIGQIKLGILEPAPEYVLFTLPVGAVAGPVETPRGYWIVKRLE